MENSWGIQRRRREGEIPMPKELLHEKFKFKFKKNYGGAVKAEEGKEKRGLST